MTEEDIKKLQSTGGDHLAATEKNILGNDLDKLWESVASLKGGRIDFVLDNAGFELYCDCVYGKSCTPLSSTLTNDRDYLSSRLLNPVWLGVSGTLPWQAICLVRFGRDAQGLGLAAQLVRVRKLVPDCKRGRGHESARDGEAVETI